MPESLPALTLRWLVACAAGAMLLGCSTPPPAPPPAAPPAAREAPPVAPPPPEPVALPAAPRSTPSHPLAAALAYADRVRGAPAAALAQEITRLSQPAGGPLEQMQLALALQQARTPTDNARASQTLQRLLAQDGGDARELHPLARLVQAQLVEQRRLEEAGERNAQQLREAQRRIEQLAERMEALRAIERRRPSRN